MALLLILIFFIAIPAAFATGLAGLLSVRKPDWSLRRRSAVAALGAGLTPVLLPIVSVLRGNDGGIGPLVPTVALLLLGLAMALVVGLPMALWIGKRKGEDVPSAKTFD